MKPPVARKLAVGHMCPTASFLATGGYKFLLFHYFIVYMYAWSTSMLLFLHSAFILSVMKMLLKREVGGSAVNSHGNYIADHGKIMEKSWNCVFEFLWEPCLDDPIPYCPLGNK